MKLTEHRPPPRESTYTIEDVSASELRGLRIAVNAYVEYWGREAYRSYGFDVERAERQRSFYKELERKLGDPE